MREELGLPPIENNPQKQENELSKTEKVAQLQIEIEESRKELEPKEKLQEELSQEIESLRTKVSERTYVKYPRNSFIEGNLMYDIEKCTGNIDRLISIATLEDKIELEEIKRDAKGFGLERTQRKLEGIVGGMMSIRKGKDTVLKTFPEFESAYQEDRKERIRYNEKVAELEADPYVIQLEMEVRQKESRYDEVTESINQLKTDIYNKEHAIYILKNKQESSSA